MALVKFREVDDIDWNWIDDFHVIEAGTAMVVSLDRLEAEAETLFENASALGVRLKSDETPERLGQYVDRLKLIAVDFPKFSDGRGYSSARILRDQYGFQGELRATGDVLADQLQFMQRCGFDTAQLAERVSPEAARRALARYSVVYQAASDEAAPAHRLRRLAKKQALWDVGL